ncbi:hypothetical protein ACIPIN_04695 [Pseudomonas sp. NPDC087697]|uniref:hypothetical protein n=1 Tax=Pseudomonas sp. NPDC087697 TaxID=3364447 RepID=UPI00380B3266
MSDFNEILPVLALTVTSPREGSMTASRRPLFEGMGEPFSRLVVIAYQNGQPKWGTDSPRLGSGPSWSLQVTEWDLPSGTIDLEVQMFRGSDFLGKVNRQFFIAGPPQIISPTANSLIINELRPEVSGTGSNGTVVNIYREGGAGEIYGSASVINGSWRTRLSKDLPQGGFVFIAEAKLGGQPTGWSNTVPVTVVVLSAPEITNPAMNSIQPLRPTVSGKGGYPGAQVEIYKDLASEQLGTASVNAAGNWSTVVTKDLPPGPYSITVRQTFRGESSLRSGARLFKIRPPKLAVTVTPLANQQIKFSGAGHTGAIVELTKISGPGGQALSTTVQNGQWEVTATNWVPGAYTLSAIQKVSDNAGGWIPSESIQFTFTWALPSPTEVVYTKDYTPVFSGKGYTGAMVIIAFPGGATTAAPDASVGGTGVWSSRASELWGPVNQRLIHIQQRLNGQSSPGWVEVAVTIPPLAPVITNLVENELSPTITGTCWRGAEVNLVFSGSSTVHKPSGASGSWTFRRDISFAPEVTHTVTVTQTAAGQTSPSVSRTFTVQKPLLKPVITEPQKDQEVGRELIVRGTAGVKGATMRLRDAQFDRPLGEPKVLISDGDWSMELKGLEFRKYTIDARQSIGSRDSIRSEYCFFEVVVLPPTITVPTPGGDLPRTSTMSGTGIPGGRVEVWLQGNAQPLLSNILVGENGRWEGEVTLPIGAKTILARQTLNQERPSKDSPRLTYNVVPAAPFIETPAEAERVGRQVVVSGFGYSGDTVAVAFADAPQTLLGQAPVVDRTWSVRVTLDRAGGAQRLMAVQSRDGFKSVQSPARSVLLGSYLPTIDKPEQGRWVTDPVGVAGKGRVGTGELVSWFNPDRVWASGVPVTAQGWQRSVAQPLPNGGNWVRFRQVIQGETGGSDWAESERFEVGPQPPLSD